MIFAVASAASLKPLMHSTIAGAKMLSYATHGTTLERASLGRKSLTQQGDKLWSCVGGRCVCHATIFSTLSPLSSFIFYSFIARVMIAAATSMHKHQTVATPRESLSVSDIMRVGARSHRAMSQDKTCSRTDAPRLHLSSDQR